MNDAPATSTDPYIDVPSIIFGGLTFRQVLAQPCTKCGAKAGGRCSTPTSYGAKTHAVRVKAAIAARGEPRVEAHHPEE